MAYQIISSPREGGHADDSMLMPVCSTNVLDWGSVPDTGKPKAFSFCEIQQELGKGNHKYYDNGFPPDKNT